MGYDVFIAHASNDEAVANEVCLALEAAGFRSWIAPRDVRPGVEYGGAIIEAIDMCRFMVLILSSSANASTHVHREIERAVSKGVTIVPIRIEPIIPTRSMEYFLGSIHWLDAITPPLSQHLPHLIEAIKGSSPASRQVLPPLGVTASALARRRARSKVALVLAAVVAVSVPGAIWGKKVFGHSTDDGLPTDLANVCYGDRPSYWNHDGSIFFLVGSETDQPRTLYYCQGPHAGRVLFSGNRVADSYLGTAYSVSEKCGSFPYDVNGPVFNHDQSVIIKGRQPLIDETTCDVNGHKDVSFRFDHR